MISAEHPEVLMSSMQIIPRIPTLKLVPAVAALVLSLSPHVARAGDNRSIHPSPTSPIAQATTNAKETPKAGKPSDGARGMNRTSEPSAQPAITIIEISPDESTFYDRYMKAGAAANRKGDYQWALIFFQRALDEQPNDVFALQALNRVQAQLARDQQQPAAMPSPQSGAQ